MWKTVAKFISEPVYQEISFMKFYKATLENKEGKFECSFGKKYLQDYSPEKKICLLKCEKTSYGFRCCEILFLDNNEEVTNWEKILTKEDKVIKNKEELEEKLRIITNLLSKETKDGWNFQINSRPLSIYLECQKKPHLKFLISDMPAKNPIILDTNSALNHLKNIYVDLTKIDVYYLFKDIQERVKILEKLTN